MVQDLSQTTNRDSTNQRLRLRRQVLKNTNHNSKHQKTRKRHQRKEHKRENRDKQ